MQINSSVFTKPQFGMAIPKKFKEPIQRAAAVCTEDATREEKATAVRITRTMMEWFSKNFNRILAELPGKVTAYDVTTRDVETPLLELSMVLKLIEGFNTRNQVEAKKYLEKLTKTHTTIFPALGDNQSLLRGRIGELVVESMKAFYESKKGTILNDLKTAFNTKPQNRGYGAVRPGVARLLLNEGALVQDKEPISELLTRALYEQGYSEVKRAPRLPKDRNNITES